MQTAELSMGRISQEQLNALVALHDRFLTGRVGGRRAILENVDLTRLSLNGQDLRQAIFSGCVMEEMDLSHANFQEAALYACDLSRCNLYKTVFIRSDLRGARIENANLESADLESADLRKGGIARDGNFSHVQKAVNFRGANLTGAKLTGSMASNADFSDATLTGANLEKADLRGASLEGANMANVNVLGAQLVGANIKSAIKRNRQNEKRRVANLGVRSRMRTYSKKALEAAGSDESDEALRLAMKHIDKAASKGVIHKNAAARQKSRLVKAVRTSAASD